MYNIITDDSVATVKYTVKLVLYIIKHFYVSLKMALFSTFHN